MSRISSVSRAILRLAHSRATNAFFVARELCEKAFPGSYEAESHYQPPRYWLKHYKGHRPGFGPFVSSVETTELCAKADRLTGSELEQAVTSGLYAAFAESRELTEADLANALEEVVPLYDTYEERIKELRDWGKNRTRPASVEAKMIDLFPDS